MYQPASATPIRVEDHLGLVMHLAKRYAGSYQGQHLLDLEDLYQEGVLGLMHAAEKFDARKGFRFSTYATYWIRWAIGQAIMNESRHNSPAHHDLACIATPGACTSCPLAAVPARALPG